MGKSGNLKFTFISTGYAVFYKIVEKPHNIIMTSTNTPPVLIYNAKYTLKQYNQGRSVAFYTASWCNKGAWLLGGVRIYQSLSGG